MVKPAIGLNVAVVGISRASELGDEPPGGWIVDVLEEAGHHVVERVHLVDDLPLIRGRFAKWIAGSDVDVVIATCDLRSTSTASALAPLITRPLAGFGDMLQRLTLRDEMSATALVDVKAALCTSTFVFLLPTSIGALRIALDRLVLPRLDYRAKPRETRRETKTIPPPLPARAVAPSEIDELFSEPILLVTPKAPARPSRRGEHEVIAGVSSWAPKPRKRRGLQLALVASLLMMASAAAIAIPYVTEREQQTRAQEPAPVAAARTERPTAQRLVTVAPPIASASAEPAPARAPSPPQHVAKAEPPVAKPAVETPAPAPAEPAAVAPVEAAPAVAENPAPPVATSCDEVSCTLDNYEGACCAKFKPTEVAKPKPATQLPDRIDGAMIFDGMTKMKPAIKRCDERYGVKGTVSLKVKVGPDGAVADVSVASSPDAALGDCVATAIRKASFAQTEAGGSFHYPFTF